jgi:hypothetical protein
MIEPVIISVGQLHRLEMLVAKYMEYPQCKPRTWGKPRSDRSSSCKVDVNRPVQYLSQSHQLEDCEENYDSISESGWSFESIASRGEATPTVVAPSGGNQ